MALATTQERIGLDSQTRLLDGITPVAAFDTLRRALGGPCFLLESAPAPDECARHSIIGIGRVGELRLLGGVLELAAPGDLATLPPDRLLEGCRRLLAACAPAANSRRFLGAYGVTSFELAGAFERLGTLPDGASDEPDLHLIVPATFVVFDHFTHAVTVSTLTTQDAAPLRADDIFGLLHGARLGELARLPAPAHMQRPAQPDYEHMVIAAKDAIVSGDLLQIVLSQELRVRSTRPPFDVYRELRSINPSPYMFYLELGDATLFGCSPEALCRLSDRRARIRPLAGTRPRPTDVLQEKIVAAELQRDPKERAEHTMLVDLARNDLGRVCEYGSVQATDLFTVERFSHVLHLASEVQGTLRAGFDAFDLFAAAFPAGTVSGAPKIRALQRIREFEGRPRGWYGGCVVHAGFDGSLDACITLRGAVARPGEFSVRAGAGIVADSVPEHEDAECRAKAAAVLAAIQGRARELR